MNNTIRIRTTPNGTDKYLNLKIEQDFDFIEILSLSISQDKAYENFCSDYGTIVGRVVINSGFGVPNAKVSVFIPIDDIDKESPLIKGLYPYETVSDKDSNGVRYNLLPKESDSQDDCYTPVGTFPAKREILDNPDMLYVYKKYYKFTTQTNYAGDFMIFGVPVGQHTVHVDMDISNIGVASQRPYDLIEQGAPLKMFYSPTKFKDSKNLNSLPQIKSATLGVNVRPFWGDMDTCQIGITRLDFDMNYTIKPAAFFTGGVFGDNDKNSVNKHCRPRRKMGRICEQMVSEGSIEMIRKTLDDSIERFDVEGGRLIDANGAWAYQVPMNLDYVITDEYGKLIPSEDTSIGIPTRARVRFRMSMDESGGLGRFRTRAKYLVPHNPATINDLDFNFDTTTKDSSFVDMHWNKIYTVKNFIPKVKKSASSNKTSNYVGIKDVDACVGDKNPFPYNRSYAHGDPLFFIFCILLEIISLIIAIANFLPDCIFCHALCLPFGIGCPICGLVPSIRVKCITEDDECIYTPSFCSKPFDGWAKCMSNVLADKLGLFQFDFYNDWVNGSLYYYLLKYKRRRNGSAKFCDYDCEKNGSINDCYDNEIQDSTFSTEGTYRYQSFSNGLIIKYQDELYYSPVLSSGDQHKLFATDITNLGAVFDCDWQGFPKIIQYLTPTSYKLPPLTPEQSVDDKSTNYVGGIFSLTSGGECLISVPAKGLFFTVDCLGVHHDGIQANNIRRICELSVDIPEDANVIPEKVTFDNSIYEPDEIVYSLQKYTRDSFTLLNISGASISTLPQINYNLNDEKQGTSFGGQLYNDFRHFIIPNNELSFEALDNSYYLYFGAIPGKTGLDKLNSKYFTRCIKKNLDDYIIRTNITNTSSNTNKDGSILFTFIGGTPPFSYSWTGPNYIKTPTTVKQTDTITNLGVGLYKITAVDALGTIVTKEVNITGPQALTFKANLDLKPSNSQSKDGRIIIQQLYGGTTPYTLKITDPNGNVSTIPNVSSQNSSTLTGIFVGSYKLEVIDSSSPAQSSVVNINVTTQPPLNLGDIGANNAGCFCTASINPEITFISGGFSPYTVEITTKNTPVPLSAKTITLSGVTNGTSLSEGNFCTGTYNIKVTDSRGASKTKDFNLSCRASGPFSAIIADLQTIIFNSASSFYIDEDGNPVNGNFYPIIPINALDGLKKASWSSNLTSPKLRIFKQKTFGFVQSKEYYFIESDGTGKPSKVTINDGAGCRYVINTP